MALRVAVDATSLYDVQTGIGRFTRSLLDHMVDDPTVDLRAFAVTWRGHADLSTLLPPGVTAVPGRMAAGPLRAAWRRSDHPRIERWTGAIDLVHGPNYVVPPARVPQVMSIHDLTFIHHPEYCTADVLQYPPLIRRALARGAWVHTDSEFVREEVIDHFDADPSRVIAVPLGVTRPPAGDLARGRALAGGERFVLALGTIEPRKNLPALVAAFDGLAARDAEVRLVVAGPDGWGTAAYDAAVAAAAHADRIVRVGFVSEADRGALLAAAAVVAIPSHYEGFGLGAAEALAAGAPVVASAAGSHPEIVGDAALLIDPTDVSALGAALERVLEDESLGARLRAAGPPQTASLTWSRTAAGITGLWHRAVEGNGPAH